MFILYNLLLLNNSQKYFGLNKIIQCLMLKAIYIKISHNFNTVMIKNALHYMTLLYYIIYKVLLNDKCVMKKHFIIPYSSLNWKCSSSLPTKPTQFRNTTFTFNLKLINNTIILLVDGMIYISRTICYWVGLKMSDWVSIEEYCIIVALSLVGIAIRFND